ncbi:MAG: hypothetical protein KDK37_04900 [Leptospiraceae bacterium]|nr:hypothetical protein [Leptospiraceae bacterium]
MNFLEVMQSYFRGEKLEALYFILPIGLLLIALGIVALRAEKGGFAWGVAIPCFVFGALLLVTGATVGFRTSAQVAALQKSYAQSPGAMAGPELKRMEKVNKNFRFTFYAFGAVALLGLLLHYLVPADWARGLGAVLILGAAIGLLIDGFAERRAEPYTEALRSLPLQSGPSGDTSLPRPE